MSSDLQRPSDEPRPPDEPPGDPPDQPPRIRDSYVDDPDDIFDTTDIPKESAQHRDTARPPADDADENHRVDLDSSSEADENVDEPFEFDPRRANLNEISPDEASAYIADTQQSRPWLTPAADSSSHVQRVYAASDQGGGHALPRHDGYGDDDLHQRRVQYLEDPAQLDDAKRVAGIDGVLPGDKKHYCGGFSTRIRDADAFATAFVRGIEHPTIREMLDRPYEPGDKMTRRFVDISELLGEDGHHYCSGFRLAGPDLEQALKDRKSWLKGERRDDLAEPTTEPIPTFEGGQIEFRFGRNQAGDRYEILTMFPVPPKNAGS